MSHFIAAPLLQSKPATKAQLSLSIGPKTGWPKFLGLYSSMVHVSQADIITVFATDASGNALLMPFYSQGRTDPSYYLPTASVVNGQTPQQAASNELYNLTGHTAPNMTSLGRVLVEIDKRVATTYLFFADQANKEWRVERVADTKTHLDARAAAKPKPVALPAVQKLLSTGAFPVEIHRIAITRALQSFDQTPDPKHA